MSIVRSRSQRAHSRSPDVSALGFGGFECPNAALGVGEKMAELGVRREKAALSSGCEAHPANRSSRKQSEQSWR